MAIWKTRKSKLLGEGSFDAEYVLKATMAARIEIEHEYLKMENYLIMFSEICCVGSVLCEIFKI